MSASRDPDQILHAWLEEGPTVLPACRATPSEWATRTIDGAAGSFVSVMCPTPHGEAVVVSDGVGYAINGDLVHVETVLESFQAP